MPEETKFAFIHFPGSTQSLKVYFDDEMNEMLVNDGWPEFIHKKEDGGNQHFLFAPVNGPIAFIEWIE